MQKIWIGLLACILWLGLSWVEGGAGTVAGTVSIRTEKKPKRPPRYYMGPYRSDRGTDVEESGPTDVVVYIEGVEGYFTPPARHPEMHQKGESFVPHTLPVLAGTTVDFPNDDDFYHNVFSVVAGDRFDLGRYPKGKSAQQTFDKRGLVVVRCEIHPGMKAYILVLENPYFRVPDPEGQFRIPGVPAGTYAIKAWHSTQGERSQTVVVPQSGEVKVEFAF